jgi:hypothetical protein
MLHQPIELGIPSAAEARRRRFGRKQPITDADRKQAADRTAVLIDAIDEAFATLPYPAQDKKRSDSASPDSAADLRHQTDSLAGMLASQLKDLDAQRGRLARLLAQIDHRGARNEERGSRQ